MYSDPVYAVHRGAHEGPTVAYDDIAGSITCIQQHIDLLRKWLRNGRLQIQRYFVCRRNSIFLYFWKNTNH